MTARGLPVSERMWLYIAPEPMSGCWLWTGCMGGDGYGSVRINGKTLLAHRVSYSLWRGSLPADQLVCHKCDTRLCVNPDHLFLGDHAANKADAVSKRRHTWGERNPSSKLTEADVIAIRVLRSTGMGAREIAARYGVGRGVVYQIIRGERWGHVQLERRGATT